MALRLDRLQAANFNPRGMQTLWQRHCEALEGNSADLQGQIDALTNLNSDNVLTPAKKPQWILWDSMLTGEQSALDAEATSYGITTEKTAYDDALAALASYLATLTTAVAWNDLSGNTTIDGPTFRSKFTDVTAAKTALQNKMHETARSLANTAQTAADAVTLSDKITASSVIPADCLTGSDAGSSATITIAANTRLYGDSSELAVSGGLITGLAYATDYGVYYDDPTCADTTPSYHATTTLSHALNNYVVGRHFVGALTTPAAGTADTTGGSAPPATGGEFHNRFDTI
jgi:hypothetical protein